MKAVAVSKNEFLQNELGKTVDVLFETKTKDGLYEGKTANYITVHAPSDENISGRILKTALMSTENGIIFGKTVD